MPSPSLAALTPGASSGLDPGHLGATAAALVVVTSESGAGKVVEADSLANEGLLFQVASAGKHLTACLILDLAAAGRLHLDDDVRVYLPETPSAWGSIPIRTLLHHTSGLPDYLLIDAPPPIDSLGFFAVCDGLAPLAPPGDCWSYSNTNYILLGLIAARAGSSPAGEQMQALLERHGAGSARIASPSWVRQTNRLHRRDTVYDQQSLLREVVGDGDVAFDIKSASAWLKCLLDPPGHWRELHSAEPTKAGPALYGAGLFVEPFPGLPLIHHAGHFDGWTAALVMNVERQSAVLAMCNGAPGHTRSVRRLAVAALEEAAPGATPLSLRPQPDPNPDLSGMIRRQLLRGSESLDPNCFVQAMAPLVRQAEHGRGIVNLGLSRDVQAFALVDQAEVAGATLLRYRVDYGDRLEHLCVGVSPDAKICWAWPI